MIYNLVEAAQEFLSEVIPQEQSYQSAVYHDTNKGSQLSSKDGTVRSRKLSSARGPFVISHLDVFCGSGELWQWNLEMEESSKVVSSQIFDSSKLGNASLDKQPDKQMKLPMVESFKPENANNQSLILGTVEEESEDEAKTTDLSTDESVENDATGHVKDIFVGRNSTEAHYSSSNSDSESLLESAVEVQSLQTMKRDLLLAHLLRLACAPKGALADALPDITSELLNLGNSSKVSHFWKIASDVGDQSSSVPNSRYLNDFEELQPLGA